jgi:serine/threonine-protein kinase SRPK3
MKHYLIKALAKKNKFFAKQTESSDDSGSLSSDDEDEVSKDIIYKWYNNRYFAIKYLGKGTFCRTWLMYDIHLNKFVAMKMYYSKYHEESLHEIKINKLLTYPKYVVHILDHFVINKSQCLIYELLGLTLLDLLDYYDDDIPLNIVKQICIQIFKGIDELHKNNIVHCDLKAENIMLKQLDVPIKNIIDELKKIELDKMFEDLVTKNLPENYNEFDKNKKKNVKRKIKIRCIKLLGDSIKSKVELNKDYDDEFKFDETNIECKIIDLGNSEILGVNNEDEIMIRSYRPPENIMNSFYNEKADIWGMGCIIYELLTGEYLFDIDRDLKDNEKDRQHLHQMYETLGKIPKDYALDCEFSEQLFDNQGRIVNYKQCNYTNLEEIFITDYEYNENNAKNISNFLKKLLDYNIKTRYSAQQAYTDIWLNEANEVNEVNEVNEDN